MQNKSALWIFTLLLGVACLYVLSFTWVTASVESEAKEIAQEKLDSLLLVTPELTAQKQGEALDDFESNILLSKNSEEVYPLLGYTYRECKRRELSKGLDLQGGMNVTLEVSVVELIEVMSSNSENSTFTKAVNNALLAQKESQDDFTTLFGQEVFKLDPEFELWRIFHNKENKDLFPKKISNKEVLEIIRKESTDAVKRTEQVLRKRIDNLGVVQPKIQRLTTSDRIIVELPGVKDEKRVRKILQGTAKLEFWDCYDNREILGGFEKANEYLKSIAEVKPNANELDPAEPNTIVDADLSNNKELSSVADSNSTDTASNDDFLTDLDGEKKESNLLDDLAGDSTDKATADEEEFNFDEFASENPLFAVVQLNLYQGENQQTIAGEGPIVGYVAEKNRTQVEEYFEDPKIMREFPKDIKFLWAAKSIMDNDDQPTDVYAIYAIKVKSRDGNARMEGDVITNASVQSDPNGNPEISMTMNSTGARKWKEITLEASTSNINGEPLKRSVAIVLDDKVYTAPTVQGEISGGHSSISGQFTPDEAADLANVLKAGKLPVSAKIIEEAIVGPSLGQESIENGMLSFALAFLLILVYMVFYYGKAGGIADVALIANIFFVFGVLTSIHATLTLPGIAGIVLTIGMSVDANVLIYERIREEIRAGKGMKLAIHDGYQNAYSSIIDANITTLLTGIILLIFGTGPIKGFATTLIIGILTSLFSAIFITRLIFEWYLSKKENVSFSTRWTDNVFNNLNFKFIGKRRMYYVISSIIILAGVVSLATRGLNYGVDFTGGRSYLVSFEKNIDVNKVGIALANVFVDENGLKQRPEVKTYGTANQVKITTKYMINESGIDTEDKVVSTMYSGLNTLGLEYEKLSSQLVEPTIADDIKQSAIWAVLFSILTIFLYILIRFRKWQFGLGALVAVFHDVLVVLGVFSIFYSIAPWSMEIDQAFIAAILTVVGYSINDTVVVFDRIREFVGLHKNRPYKQVVNDALNSTLSRTINTSMSTFLVLLMIFIFGGEVIRGFVFALMVGVVVGTYSSLCVAAPTVIDLSKEKDSE
jgi:SecD/SecF fusion protein|tara:strand:- start:13539 stop:16697 length:3159 start_codon:yes stop_codon:yes gene_type:complete